MCDETRAENAFREGAVETIPYARTTAAEKGRIAVRTGRSASYEAGERVALISVLLGALALSVLASSGPIQWMDNGFLLFIAAQGDYVARELSATSHPLYHSVTAMLYKLFGVHGVAYFNSLLMAPLAYVVYRVGKALGLDAPYAVLAALGVILLHNVFWVSTKMEVYALHLLIVMTAYAIVFDHDVAVRRTAVVVGVLTGLGAATHQLTIIVLAPLYLYLLPRCRWRLLWALPGLLLGLAPCYPAMLHEFNAGSDAATVIRIFLTGSDGAASAGWEGALFRFDKIFQDKHYAVLVLVSLCGVGLLGAMRKPATLKQTVIWTAAVLNLLFAVSYGVSDRFTFFLPGAAFFAILGVAEMSRRYGSCRVGLSLTLTLILLHPLLLVGASALAGSGLVTLPTQASKLPFRDDVRYFLAPYLRDTSAHSFILAYAQQVPEGSVVLSDYSPMGALRSAQVNGQFLNRELIGCEEERAVWPDTMYLVRKDYCEQVIKGYKAVPALLGWIVSR